MGDKQCGEEPPQVVDILAGAETDTLLIVAKTETGLVAVMAEVSALAPR